MPFSIDHVVIASDDLDTAIVNARAAGFTVVPGGAHGSGNTQNALIGFADASYLELFAPTHQGRAAEHRWFARIRNGGGLVDFCLLGADLKTEVARIRRSAVQYSAPFSMARLRPDGVRIEWLLSTPPGVTGQNGWPFLIEDVTPRAVRVPHSPEEIAHANGAAGVAGITVLVRDLLASGKAYEAILGTPSDATVDDRAVRRFSVQDAWIELRQPDSVEETEHVERHGQGPYKLTLRSKSGQVGAEGVLLNPSLFAGARIAVA